MFNSIFRRIMIPTVGLVLLLVAALGLTASLMYRNALIEEKHRSLEAGAVELSRLASLHLEGQLSLEALNAAVNAVGSSTDTMVYLINVTEAQLEAGFDLESTGLTDDFILDHLRFILQGKSVFNTTPYSDTFASYVLFQGYPIYLQGEAKGAVLLLSPIEGFSEVLYDLNLTYAGIALGALLLSLPLILWHSRHISEPIRKMEETTRLIAAGEDAPLEPVRSKDEIGRLYASFLHMKEALEKTEAIRKDLIANVSHELRTPLTSINGFVQSMMDGLVSEADRDEILGLVKDETQHLIHLTADLLELAKLQAGTRPLRIDEILLEPLVHQVMNSMKAMADERGIALDADLPPTLKLDADADALRQILTNLIDNAIKYSMDGGAVALRVSQQRGGVEFCVADQGPGIPEEALPMVFDKFYRADARSGSGTGLGLSIVKALVTLHHGDIWAESNQPHGTRMIFNLPQK
ncbi:MAG: HAMP domain-containing protein [Acidaminobacter sp.]|uniref:sensor histidine kinase n=1 Tax=Acidaminobacter sp. TaxID=1872102 RepID=UPI00137E9DAD|nr:HAMP domain-containing sensor histidine kinase [Acidaminobacter sp.]MZQ99081.1 HAMP domain-containing protein [Acidaminobacter sp.]